ALRQIDEHEQLRRREQFAVGTARDARIVAHDLDIVAREHARHLAVRSAAQNDRRLGRSGRDHHVTASFADRAPTAEHRTGARAIVLPATRRMVKKTAVRIAVTIAPMLPICSANPLMNAFSVSVFVSYGEFANFSSIRFTMSSACFGSLILM